MAASPPTGCGAGGPYRLRLLDDRGPRVTAQVCGDPQVPIPDHVFTRLLGHWFGTEANRGLSTAQELRDDVIF